MYLSSQSLPTPPNRVLLYILPLKQIKHTNLNYVFQAHTQILFAPTSKSNTHVQHTLNMLWTSIISLHISGRTCQGSNVVPLKLQLNLDLQFSYNLAQSCDDIQGACYTNVWRLGKAGYCQAKNMVPQPPDRN